MKLVIDTSILIDYFRGGLRWDKFLKQIETGVELFIPTIVIFELFSGDSSKDLDKEKDITHFLEEFTKIELNERIAKIAGELYRDIDKSLGVSDYIIAASALSINAQVVTLNEKHFIQIPNLQIYPL